MSELLEIRCVLEVGLIDQALSTMPDATRDELQAVVATMHAKAERDEAFAAEDRRFHQLLFEHLGNRTLLKLLDVFWLAYREASEQADLRNRDPVATVHDHAAIADAITAGDTVAAQQALERHYAGLRGRLTDVGASSQPKPAAS